MYHRGMSRSHYTVNELAEIFRYSPQTIRRLIKAKRIFAFRLGKSNKSPYRILAQEVERLAIVGFEEQNQE